MSDEVFSSEETDSLDVTAVVGGEISLIGFRKLAFESLDWWSDVLSTHLRPEDGKGI